VPVFEEDPAYHHLAIASVVVVEGQYLGDQVATATTMMIEVEVAD